MGVVVGGALGYGWVMGGAFGYGCGNGWSIELWVW